MEIIENLTRYRQKYKRGRRDIVGCSREKVNCQIGWYDEMSPEIIGILTRYRWNGMKNDEMSSEMQWNVTIYRLNDI